MMQCSASKENIIYILDVMRQLAEQAFDILSDAALKPLYPEEELQESRDMVDLQQTELPSEAFSRDLVQRAAYIGSPLGNHHYCPVDTVATMNKDKLLAFRANRRCLYAQVLNRRYWAESVESFLAVHEHAGLLGIHGACPPESLPSLAQVIIQQFGVLATVPVTDEELSRAKNMLKSSMMMQLELRLVNCEDIARQFITYGHRDSLAKMCEKIDAVTKRDLMAVATRVLLQMPSVGAVGSDLSKLPQYEHIAAFFKDNYVSQVKAQADLLGSSFFNAHFLENHPWLVNWSRKRQLPSLAPTQTPQVLQLLF